MKHCTANIIMNSKGEILLLKRAIEDEFHGGTFCLAGGGIDDGEDELTALKRETKEEAGVEPEDYIVLKKIKIEIPSEKVTIWYFISMLKDDDKSNFVYLDEVEHCNYQWSSYEEWKELDLILDLKFHLADILGLDTFEKGGVGSGKYDHKKLDHLYNEKRILNQNVDKADKSLKEYIISQGGSDSGGLLSDTIRTSKEYIILNSIFNKNFELLKQFNKKYKNDFPKENIMERQKRLKEDRIKNDLEKSVTDKHIKYGIDKNGKNYMRKVNNDEIPTTKRKTPVIKLKTDLKPKVEHWSDEFKKYNVNKLPIGIDKDKVSIKLDGDIHSHSIMTWRDPKSGKQCDAYTKEFLQRNADLKWERMKNVNSKIIDSIKKKAETGLGSSEDKIKQCSAIILIIANTGLRIGSRDNYTKTKNRGVSTLSPTSIKIKGDTIDFNFTGKSYKENISQIKNKKLADVLKVIQKDAIKQDSDFLFDYDRSPVDNVFKNEFGFKGLKLKDMRTYIATSVAKDILYEDKDFAKKLTTNDKENKKLILTKFNDCDVRVSKILNNSPKMARDSYIHPNVKTDFLIQLGLNVEEFKKSFDLNDLETKPISLDKIIKRLNIKPKKLPNIIESEEENCDIFNKQDWEMDDTDDDIEKSIKKPSVVTKVIKTIHRKNGTVYTQRYKHKEDTAMIKNDGVGNKDINIDGFQKKEIPAGSFEQRTKNWDESSINAGLKDRLFYSIRFGDKYYDKEGIEINIPDEYNDVIRAKYDSKAKTLLSGTDKEALKKSRELQKEILLKVDKNKKSIKDINEICDELFSKYQKVQRKILTNPKNVNQLQESVESTTRHISKNLSSINNITASLETVKKLVNSDVDINITYGDKVQTIPIDDLLTKLKNSDKDKNQNMGIQKIEISNLNSMTTEDFNIDFILDKSKVFQRERIFNKAKIMYKEENNQDFNEELKQSVNIFK